MRIYLVGFMGAGKTWGGKQMAKRLNLDFVDVDECIVKREGMDITAIFNQKGESVFREIEADCLRQTALLYSAIIATGGGTPCFLGNMEWINGNGLSIYLKNSVDTLFERLKNERASRPLIGAFSDDELWTYIEKKLAERSFFYEQSHLCCEPSSNEMDHVLEAVSFLGRFLPAK